MKRTLFLAVVASLALTGAPASTQTTAPPVDTMGTPYQGEASGRNSPYRGPDFSPAPNQCFNGRNVVGANRFGPKTVVVQTGRGAIYKLQLADGCEALNAAEKIAVRGQGYSVCSGSEAVLISHTSTGAKRCQVKDVRRLTTTEMAPLAATARP